MIRIQRCHLCNRRNPLDAGTLAFRILGRQVTVGPCCARALALAIAEAIDLRLEVAHWIKMARRHLN